mgnify:FL=1
MKVINYNYGYNNFFNCSIHGKIILNKTEWKNALSFLFRGAKRWYPSYPWVKEVLKEDIERFIPTKTGKLYNIRVPATETLVEKYNLKKYKRGNYTILVLN